MRLRIQPAWHRLQRVYPLLGDWTLIQLATLLRLMLGLLCLSVLGAIVLVSLSVHAQETYRYSPEPVNQAQIAELSDAVGTLAIQVQSHEKRLTVVETSLAVVLALSKLTLVGIASLLMAVGGFALREFVKYFEVKRRASPEENRA